MEAPQLDAPAALAFLRLLYPSGPWHLVSIEPDSRRTGGRTFRPGDEDALAAWLTAQNTTAARNVYYHVNPAVVDPGPETNGKSTRASTARVAYLHVDVDPRAREDLTAEQLRIERALADAGSRGLPPPTGVIFSGGGCNGLWALCPAVEIVGDSPNAREASADALARYNLQIERAFEADYCHNVDRILRVAGTVNWPDEGKRKKGRTPSLARLLSWDASRVYPIERFTAAPIAPAAGPGAGQRRASVSGSAPKYRDAAELPDTLSARARELIVHGEVPSEPGRFKSRSEALYHACCEMVRVGMTDDQMYAVITDPKFKISESVVKKRSERYALRQIDRARDACVDPKLDQMNERHAVVRNLGGRCRVIEEVEDPVLGRRHLTKQTFEDIANSYSHEKVQVGEKDGRAVFMPLGKWWLQHPRRRTYDRVVFAPEREVAGAYNLWQGFAVEPEAGNKHESYLAHLREIICAGNDVHYEYLVSWMARAVQHPDEPGGAAIVMRGGEGVGKGFTARWFGALWGRHYLAVSDPKHLTGSFNAHLRDCVVLFADEAFYAGDKEGNEKLKTLITERTNEIEAKGIDMEVSANFVHVLMASNARWVVPAGRDSRRYLVIDVSEARKIDLAYFDAIEADLRAGGLAHLLHYFQKKNIKDWRPLPVPQTGALVEQRLLSLSSEEEWWYRKLIDGVAMPHADWMQPVPKEALLNDYFEYAKNVGGFRRATATAILQFLRRALPEGWPKSTRIWTTEIGEDRMPVRRMTLGVAFPPLDQCRVHWDKHWGTGGEWDDAEGDTVDPGPANDRDRDQPF